MGIYGAEEEATRTYVYNRMHDAALTNKWMAAQLGASGKKISPCELSRILTGVYKGGRSGDIIIACNAILRKYFTVFTV